MSASNRIVVHYDEIGLKSANRGKFERRLVRNLEKQLKERVLNIRRQSGQVTVALVDDVDLDEAIDIVWRVPGVAYCSPARAVPSDMESISDGCVACAAEHDFTTFKINARRLDKSVPLRSMEVNREAGAAVFLADESRVVKMKNPDLEIKVEIQRDNAYISSRRIDGVGGLPTDPNQKVVALLSGGLDSPVAAFMMMKRGCLVHLIHFQNANQMTGCVEDKVSQLAEQLARFQVRTTLTIVPFAALQDQIIEHIPSSRRMLMYRRLMLRMASSKAQEIDARFLVVGDSLSQVASQTYENLYSTYVDSPLPVLTPLIGLDKREITDISRRIGTYDISSLPYGDCCSYFLPKHPELRGRADTLRHYDERMENLESLESAALAEARTLHWPPRETAAQVQAQ